MTMRIQYHLWDYVHNITVEIFRSGGYWFLGSGHILKNVFTALCAVGTALYKLNVTIMVMVAFFSSNDISCPLRHADIALRENRFLRRRVLNNVWNNRFERGCKKLIFHCSSFWSVSSSAHTLIIILRVITRFFSRWKYVSMSVI